MLYIPAAPPNRFDDGMDPEVQQRGSQVRRTSSRKQREGPFDMTFQKLKSTGMSGANNPASSHVPEALRSQYQAMEEAEKQVQFKIAGGAGGRTASNAKLNEER